MIHTRRLAVLERRLLARMGCPHCRDWPDEAGVVIVEEVIGSTVEAREALAAVRAEEDDPLQYGPCPACGRTHRPRIVEIIREETS
jgi:hypothetical protein